MDLQGILFCLSFRSQSVAARSEADEDSAHVITLSKSDVVLTFQIEVRVQYAFKIRLAMMCFVSTQTIRFNTARAMLRICILSCRFILNNPYISNEKEQA